MIFGQPVAVSASVWDTDGVARGANASPIDPGTTTARALPAKEAPHERMEVEEVWWDFEFGRGSTAERYSRHSAKACLTNPASGPVKPDAMTSTTASTKHLLQLKRLARLSRSADGSRYSVPTKERARA